MTGGSAPHGAERRPEAALEAPTPRPDGERHPAPSPGRLMAITMLAVFGIEAGVMAVLQILRPMDSRAEAFLDSALLSVLVFPILYGAVFRPLLSLVRALAASERELRASRSLLAEAQRVAHFGHWEWQTEADRVRLSDEAVRMFGLDGAAGGIDLATLLGVVHPDDRDRVHHVILDVARKGGRQSCEHRVLAPDGGESMVETEVEGLDPEGGATTRVIGVVHDITRRWRAQRALERAHAELDRRVRERTADLEAANRELERERSFSNAVVETSGALIVVLDNGGRVVRFNQACERTTGYRADEVRGQHVAPILLPVEEREPVMRVFDRLTAGDIPGTHRNHWLTRSGERRFISWANTAILDSTGAVEFVIGTGLDITEQRKAEEALRESEERLRSILQTAQDGFWVVDAEARLVDVNDAYCELVGYSRAELIGAHISLVEAEEDANAVQRHLAVIVGRGHDRFETRHRSRDGRLVNLEVSATYLPFSGGQIVTFLRDVTENRRYAAELERSRAELEAIFNSNADAIVFTDTERRIAFTNPAFTTMFGYAADEVRGRTTNFLDVESRPAATGGERTLLPVVENSGPRRPFEVHCRRRDGSTLWVEVLPVPVRDVRGSLLGFVGVYRDVSQRRQAEATIRASLREKEVLLKEIHHRVKNNLQVIASLLNLQADQLQDPAAVAPLRESQNRIRSLALIHEKLYRSRDLARIDFRDYVEDLAASIVASVDRGQTRVRLESGITDVSFDIDTAIPLALIVNELVSNSVKHAFAGRAEGGIRILLEHETDGGFLLAVEDDGAGVPDTIDVHATTTLGLQLVEVLSTQIGGSFDLVPAAGARFELRFRPESRPDGAG